MDKIFKEIEGVFKQPIKSYYFGRLAFGTPYFYPRNFSSSILNVRKLKLISEEELNKITDGYKRRTKKFSNLPMCRRSKDWILKIGNSYFWFEIGWPIKVIKYGLGWKDKYDTPRFEWQPSFQIYFFKWQFCIFWNAPDDDNDLYYEPLRFALAVANGI